jgi:hypothetical protein
MKGVSCVNEWMWSSCVDNLNTTQTLEYTKDRYNVKIRNERVSPKVPSTTYVGQRMK